MFKVTLKESGHQEDSSGARLGGKEQDFFRME